MDVSLRTRPSWSHGKVFSRRPLGANPEDFLAKEDTSFCKDKLKVTGILLSAPSSCPWYTQMCIVFKKTQVSHVQLPVYIVK